MADRQNPGRAARNFLTFQGCVRMPNGAGSNSEIPPTDSGMGLPAFIAETPISTSDATT
jgi:hypothetical protein